MDTSQITALLKEYPLFKGLSAEQIAPLLSGHRFKNLHHHEVLYVAGDSATSFALILTGAFKLVRPTPRGEDSIVYFATPGDVVGGLVMLKPDSRFPVSAVSLGASTALILPRATFAAAWATNAAIQLTLNSTLYVRMTSLQDYMANTKLSLQMRIASLFMSLLDKQKETTDTHLPLPLTRQEIADSVGSSVESVIRCMSEMTQQGLIQTENKQIEILRTDKIAELLKFQ